MELIILLTIHLLLSVFRLLQQDYSDADRMERGREREKERERGRWDVYSMYMYQRALIFWWFLRVIDSFPLILWILCFCSCSSSFSLAFVQYLLPLFGFHWLESNPTDIQIEPSPFPSPSSYQLYFRRFTVTGYLLWRVVRASLTEFVNHSRGHTANKRRQM